MNNIPHIRVFEAFAGYGSQAMALKRLQDEFPDSVSFEFVGISEIEPNAIKAYSAVHGETINYGDISKINWGGQIPDFDLFTYSFPCQDISNAGQQRGFAAGSGSRSSLLWECCRCIEQKKPQYLLMENVKSLVSEKFKKDFSSWVMWLEGQGYRNFWQVLNAKDYGIPQNRERVFMVSILDCADMYIFPKSFKLEKRLKDVLEDNVDESFYLSDKRIANFIENLNGGGRISEHQWGLCYSKEANFINTLCAHAYKYAPKIVDRPNACLKKNATVMQVGQMYGTENNSQRGRVYSPNGISPCLMSHEQGAGIEPKIIQRERGFNKGGIKDECPTISANSWECNNLVCFGKEATTICINSKVNGKQPSFTDRIYSDNGVMTACTPTFRQNVLTNFRIRKLTPRECFRLMDCTESDIDKIQAAGISNSAQYRLAGNSIVVSCLYHIFRKMFVDKQTDPGQVVQLSLF